jgi:hypothetical protein
MKDTQEKDIASADYLDCVSNSCQSKLYSSEKDQPKSKKKHYKDHKIKL